jgi:hypothetical protein
VPSQNVEAARSLIKFLTAPAAAPVTCQLNLQLRRLNVAVGEGLELKTKDQIAR